MDGDGELPLEEDEADEAREKDDPEYGRGLGAIDPDGTTGDVMVAAATLVASRSARFRLSEDSFPCSSLKLPPLVRAGGILTMVGSEGGPPYGTLCRGGGGARLVGSEAVENVERLEEDAPAPEPSLNAGLGRG